MIDSDAQHAWTRIRSSRYPSPLSPVIQNHKKNLNSRSQNHKTLAGQGEHDGDGDGVSLAAAGMIRCDHLGRRKEGEKRKEKLTYPYSPAFGSANLSAIAQWLYKTQEGLMIRLGVYGMVSTHWQSIHVISTTNPKSRPFTISCLSLRVWERKLEEGTTTTRPCRCILVR